MSMTAKPEEQAKSEEESRAEEAEGKMLIKLREEAEAEFDAFCSGKPNKSESEEAAEAAEREVNRKIREEENARVRSAYKRNSAEAGLLTKSESEMRDEAESKMRLETRQEKLREEAEADYDALFYGNPNKSETQEAAEAAQREVLRKIREEDNARIRSAYRRNSAEAGPLTKSESELRDEAERKMRLETRQEKLFQEAQADYDALFGAEWDEFLLTGETKSESGTRDQELASKSISESAAPRQQKRPRCFA